MFSRKLKARKLEELDESINFGNSEIPFKILFSKRKTIAIMVYADQSVKVRAPYRTSIKYIKKSVENRAEWIKNKQDNLKQYAPIKTKRNIEDGETYNFLGKKYDLKIRRDLVNKVYIENDILKVSVTRIDKNKIKKLIENWYRDSAKAIFTERLTICKKLADHVGIKYHGNLSFRKMKSRWGSCSRRGEITLSYELIKAPLECVDYVILHELCHIREFNHSKSFYALLDKTMPDWKHRKNELKKIREFYYE